MMKRKCRISVARLGSILALVVGITYASTPALAAEPPGWEDLKAKAREEGSLVILTGGAVPRTLMPVYRHFGDKFGIKVSIARGSGREVANRLLAERAAGKYAADIAMPGVTTTNVRLAPYGVLDPIKDYIVHPAVLDTRAWFQGRLWWADPGQKYAMLFAAEPADAVIVHYNTKLVTPKELDRIQSLWDFLDPKWAGGKIVAQPPGPGAGRSYFVAYVHPEIGPKWIRRFIEMEPFFTGEARLAADGLARGRFALGIMLGAIRRDIDALEKEGLPVANFDRPTKEALVLTPVGNTQMAVINRPAHPNATKLFVNWWYSREGQTAFNELSAPGTSQSLRGDVPPGKILPDFRRKPGVKYLFMDTEQIERHAEATKFAEDVYAELKRKK